MHVNLSILKESPQVWAEAIIKAAEGKRGEIKFLQAVGDYDLYSNERTAGKNYIG